jgi:hypothetical protein
LQELTRFKKPRCDIVEPRTGSSKPLHESRGLILLVNTTHDEPYERGVTEDVAALVRHDDVLPIGIESVGADDARRRPQWNSSERLAEFEGEAHVHNVIHHPQCDFSDAGGELGDFDAVELDDVELRQSCDVEYELAFGV